MGIFKKSDEEVELKNTIKSIESEIYRADASIDANMAAFDKQLSIFSAEKAQKWEYLVLEDIDENELDKRGKNGWELVTAASYTVGFGLGGNTSMKVHLRYIFKRPLSNEYPDKAAEFITNINEWKAVKRDLEERLRVAMQALNG